MSRFASLLAVVLLALAVSGRLLRQPDIQGDRIVFVYGADLWTVARAGGAATRLTSHEGIERLPKFSPDGGTIAFTAEYDGNTDLFTVPAAGGEPKRLTWHPEADYATEWFPDGKSILIRSLRAAPTYRYDQFFKVPAEGGFEEPLPIPTGGYASISPDGGKIAFVAPAYDNRTWKRYTGGMAPDIWVYDLARKTSEKITDWQGADEWPMWYRGTIYYASDQGGKRANLWAYELETKKRRQVTQFQDDDVRSPSIGSDAIVFEKGGELFVLDLPGEKVTRVPVQVPSDKPATRAEYRNVSNWVGGWDLSPSGKRLAIEARGEIFSVPAEKGDVRDLTRSPGSRERDPSWSPDGKWIAYLSDRTGEYELHVIGGDGAVPDRQVTKGGGPFRFPPRFSPDSKKLAFSDKTFTLSWCDVESGKVTRVDKSEAGEIREFAWSGDSRFIAYSRPEANGLGSLRLYALEGGGLTTISSRAPPSTRKGAGSSSSPAAPSTSAPSRSTSISRRRRPTRSTPFRCAPIRLRRWRPRWTRRPARRPARTETRRRERTPRAGRKGTRRRRVPREMRRARVMHRPREAPVVRMTRPPLPGRSIRRGSARASPRSRSRRGDTRAWRPSRER